MAITASATQAPLIGPSYRIGPLPAGTVFPRVRAHSSSTASRWRYTTRARRRTSRCPGLAFEINGTVTAGDPVLRELLNPWTRGARGTGWIPTPSYVRGVHRKQSSAVFWNRIVVLHDKTSLHRREHAGSDLDQLVQDLTFLIAELKHRLRPTQRIQSKLNDFVPLIL